MYYEDYLLGETQEDERFTLKHYGKGHLDGGHSGRYKWGSGEEPYQRYGDFRKTVKELKEQGLTEAEIRAALGSEGKPMSSTEYRTLTTLAKNEKRKADVNKVWELYESGITNVSEIGRIMGINESSVRSLMDKERAERQTKAESTAATLKEQLKTKRALDIGIGVEREMGVSETVLKAAVKSLEEEGYEYMTIQVPQATQPRQYTGVKVIAQPGTTYSELRTDLDLIKSVESYSVDDGKTYFNMEYPKSIDGKRVFIRYGDTEGVNGSDLDGTIFLRRGVKDIELGESSYAQVRIAVDDKYYMKGMALYSDDIPAGYDIVYNTNKKTGTPAEKVYKELKDDPDNPFGAAISRQIKYEDANGKEQLSVMNIIKEEGDWDHYSKNLASQMLSKQSLKLINNQLELTYADKVAEFDEICNLTNPAVKKKLLESFADDCDSSAVKLKANALPRQSSKVILPIPAMKDDEVYAPTYQDGEKVALIRYPHGGTFEIPILTVNNKNPQAKNTLGNAMDAIGINSKVAERLSGADFDGDTVVVIPTKGNGKNTKVSINSTDPLSGLKNFNTKSYAYSDEDLERYAKLDCDSNGKYLGTKKSGVVLLQGQGKQTEMGKVSNLITDMTLLGATEDELARAVRHSMVVIDAEKHKLDWKQSAIDNGIAELKKKYQGGANGGASTLISKAKGKDYEYERKEGVYVTDPKTGKTVKRYIDPDTGEKLYTNTNREYKVYSKDKNGNQVVKTQVAMEETTKMAKAKDARTLVSEAQTPQELAYANFANRMKDLGNKARLAYLDTPSTERNASAAKVYEKEVKSLDAKLDTAIKNAPRERQAQIIANVVVKAKKEANPEMDKSDLKRAKDQALASARSKVGASGKESRVQITESEWKAIQAGAISNSKLEKILNHTDLDLVREYATPKATTQLSEAKQSRIKAMSNSGYTIKDIAEMMGCSTSTVSKYLK